MTDPKLSRPLRVFLCHASEDKPAVRKLYARLRTDGYKPWLDEEDLLGGQDWEYEIPKAIRNSGAVLVCLSRNSINKQGYLQKEIRFVLDVADEQPEGVIFYIPLKLEQCNVPDRLRKRQWVDYFAPDGHGILCKALNERARQITTRDELARDLPRPEEVVVRAPPIPMRVVKVVVARTGDANTDAARVGEIHHILISNPGPDRFCFLVKARGETFQLDFPNDTTTFDEALIEQLKTIPGVESVQISLIL